jgi:hypothetical protein
MRVGPPHAAYFSSGMGIGGSSSVPGPQQIWGNVLAGSAAGIAALPATTSLDIGSLQEIPPCNATDTKSMRHWARTPAAPGTKMGMSPYSAASVAVDAEAKQAK